MTTLPDRLLAFRDAAESTNDDEGNDGRATYVPVSLQTFRQTIEEAAAALSGGEAVALTLGQRAVARELLACCESWEPNVCVMGNVRAKDAADLLRFVLATPPQPSAEPQQEAQGAVAGLRAVLAGDAHEAMVAVSDGEPFAIAWNKLDAKAFRIHATPPAPVDVRADMLLYALQQRDAELARLEAKYAALQDAGEWPAGVLARDRTLEILRQHNEWRRGADTEQTDPRLLGLALDAAIAAIAAQREAVSA